MPSYSGLREPELLTGLPDAGAVRQTPRNHLTGITGPWPAQAMCIVVLNDYIDRRAESDTN